MFSTISRSLVVFLIVSAVDGVGQQGSFWQITDIHWDGAYSRSGNASDWCHQHRLATSGRHHDNSAHSGGTVDNGYYGNYSCDSPWSLVQSAVNKMAAIQPNPDFILWTGDSIPHWSSGPDFDYIFPALSATSRLLKTKFPGTLIVPCLGNHDTFPANQYSVDNQSLFYERYLNEAGWRDFITDRVTFVTAGYYSVTLSAQLKILVLNTNIYYRVNTEVTADQRDPGGQLLWLRRQLTSARVNNYQVIIVSHIAPGFFELQPDVTFMYASFNDAFLGLLTQYYDVILTQIYGHSHTDSFRVMSRPVDGVYEARTHALIAPSVTPWVPSSGTNPGVRLYRYTYSANMSSSSSSRAVLLGYSQFIMNLTAANKHHHSSALSNVSALSLWRQLYSTEIDYGLHNLTAVSLSGLFRRLANSRKFFEATYLQFNTAGHVIPGQPPCQQSCHRRHLCVISQLTAYGLSFCLQQNVPSATGSSDDASWYEVADNGTRSHTDTVIISAAATHSIFPGISIVRAFLLFVLPVTMLLSILVIIVVSPRWWSRFIARFKHSTRYTALV